MKKLLFIDRDGTIVKEAPPTYQIDSFEKLEFYPGVFRWLGNIVRKLNFELVMVTNQDGLGTDSFDEKSFWQVHEHIIRSFENEGIRFSAVLIDRSFPHENSPNRKPNPGMLEDYVNDKSNDIAHSFVIGDRITDVQLAKNLGCRAIWLNLDPSLGGKEILHSKAELERVVALETTDWKEIYRFLKKRSH